MSERSFSMMSIYRADLPAKLVSLSTTYIDRLRQWTMPPAPAKLGTVYVALTPGNSNNATTIISTGGVSVMMRVYKYSVILSIDGFV